MLLLAESKGKEAKDSIHTMMEAKIAVKWLLEQVGHLIVGEIERERNEGEERESERLNSLDVLTERERLRETERGMKRFSIFSYLSLTLSLSVERGRWNILTPRGPLFKII